MGGGINSSQYPQSAIDLLSVIPDADRNLTFAEIFDKHWPWYLSLGMSYHDFWDNGDTNLCRWYRKAEKYRRKRVDEEQWFMGRYIYEAIGALSPILHVNLSGKEVHAEKYMELPILVRIENEKKLEQERQDKQQKIAMAAFASFVEELNKKRREKRATAENNAENNTAS